jgi:DNA polymerase III delta prime subunit
MSSDNHFKVFCDPIGEVITIKIVGAKELESYRDEMLSKLSKQTNFDIQLYYLKVIHDFVVDGVDLISRLEKTLSETTKELKEAYGMDADDDGLLLSYLEAIYNSVVGVYPPLSLDSLVSRLNQDKIKGFMNDYLSELYGEDEKKPRGKRKDNPAPPAREPRPQRQRTPAEAPKKSDKFIRNIQDVNQLEKRLRTEVIGQGEAVDTVVRTVKLMAANLASNCSLMFIGPTGVGKTKLARELGEVYSGNFFKINCSEFAQSHDYAKLIGSPPGYIGSGEKSIMEIKAEKSNRWVILFDEIEKASPKLFDFMLALMDDGKVMASNGKELDFSDSIILMTSNEGIRDLNVGSRTLGFGSTEITYDGSKDTLIKALKKKFSPEFLGRVDDLVYFRQLNSKELLEVAKLELKGVPVRKTKALLNYIVDRGTSEEYGARFISKFITREVKSVLADHILEGKKPAKGNLYEIKIKNNQLSL